MRWLVAHWELKLVSMVVAIALWTYTSGQVRVERTVLVEIQASQVADVPADLRVADVAPAQFVAVLSVPTGKVDELRDEVLHPVLSLPRDRRSPGRVEFALTGRTLGLASDIRILRTEPADLRGIAVELSQITEATLVAEVPAVTGLPPGLGAEVVLDRTRIDVRGPRDQVEAAAAEHRSLRFAPVHVDGIPADLATLHEERVHLHPLAGMPEPIQPVTARISIRPVRTLEATVRVVVGVLLPPGEAGRWSVSVAEPAVDLRVSGPEGLVRSLTAAEVTAWVDLRSAALAAGTSDHRLQVQAPTGVAVAVTTVHLTLQPAR